MATIAHTEYDKGTLADMHLEAFRLISKKHPKGTCVGVGSYRLRVTNNGCQLLSYYQLKDANGNWSEPIEYAQAL